MNNLAGKSITLILEVTQPDGAVRSTVHVPERMAELLIKPLDSAERAEVQTFTMEALQDLAQGANRCCDPEPKPNYFHHDPSHRFAGTLYALGQLVDVYFFSSPNYGEVVLARDGAGEHDYVVAPLGIALRQDTHELLAMAAHLAQTVRCAA